MEPHRSGPFCLPCCCSAFAVSPCNPFPALYFLSEASTVCASSASVCLRCYVTSVDRQVPLRIRKSLEGPPMPSMTTGPERSTTMTVDMYHYTAPKRQDHPGCCQVPLRFRNATSTTTTLEDIGSIKFNYNMCTTTAAVIFDKMSCASTSTTVPMIIDER
ncbi:hypothetical protein TRIUR3_21812 [Triticum urartu]|uniref:Uncharacterized protein n=1 Tax=Triticum urartu TaxID=4572 RepID=M7ZAJ2_TRIUA|nr:hypothetical protein TRIUR3_21812 [Triticum urartu]